MYNHSHDFFPQIGKTLYNVLQVDSVKNTTSRHHRQVQHVTTKIQLSMNGSICICFSVILSINKTQKKNRFHSEKKVRIDFEEYWHVYEWGREGMYKSVNFMWNLPCPQWPETRLGRLTCPESRQNLIRHITNHANGCRLARFRQGTFNWEWKYLDSIRIN